MNFIRTKVSGKKKRYIDDKYNLDLSYVTPRIIAMAFPGSGFKSIYRNDITNVGNFLRTKHRDHFLVLNLSGCKYDATKFDGNVYDFDQWPDHYPPPIELLFILIEKIHTFLLADNQNVIVVNCNAGKGRTGTLICCYLLFTGRFTDPRDAFDYYSLKRFNKGFGVTHASQQRYVKYFYEIIKTKIIPCPKIRHLIKMEVSCYPFPGNHTFYPYADVYKKVKKIAILRKNTSEKIKEGDDNYIGFTAENIDIPISGDILIELFDKGLSTSKLGRISFNVSFFEKTQNEIEFPLSEIDPYKFPIKNKVKEEYSIKLEFAPYCEKCKEIDSIEDYCMDCKKELWEEIAEYRHIQEFLHNYNSEFTLQKTSTLLFGDPAQDDVDEVMSKTSLLLTPKEDRREENERHNNTSCYIY